VFAEQGAAAAAGGGRRLRSQAEAAEAATAAKVQEWGLLLLAGCWAGLRVSSLLFGTPWRQRVLLGEAIPADLTEEGLVQGFSENRAPFFGLLAGAILLSWGAVQITTDNYLTRYNREGYYATMLRSDAPTEQVAALQQVCGVLAAETRAARPVRERVALAHPREVGHVADVGDAHDGRVGGPAGQPRRRRCQVRGVDARAHERVPRWAAHRQLEGRLHRQR
jgi:hypothetical protein